MTWDYTNQYYYVDITCNPNELSAIRFLLESIIQHNHAIIHNLEMFKKIRKPYAHYCLFAYNCLL